MTTYIRRARAILWTTTLCVAFGLAGCGGGGSSKTASTAGSSNAPSSTEQPVSGTRNEQSNAGSTSGLSGPVSNAPGQPQSVSGSEIGNGVATVQWIAPREKTDGTVLDNLAGFTIMYGTSPDDLSRTVRIDNPSIDRYMVEQLPPGTYYFAVKAYDSTGAESEPSNLLSKVIS